MRAGTIAAAVAWVLALAPVAPAAGSEHVSAQHRGLLVSLSRSGGLKPIDQVLTVKRSGRAKVSSGFGTEGKIKHFRIPPGRLDQLRDLVERTDLVSGESPPTCADCISYEIRTSGERASFNDADLVDDADGPGVPPGVIRLFNRLTTLLDRHLPSM